MDRRDFLLKSAVFLGGTLAGLNGFSKALAAGFTRDAPPYPPRVAIIIDDIGYSPSRARKFLELEVPITFAVLPRLAHSRRLAVEIHERGREVMLHQPMEPLDPHIDPGPGALYVGDDPGKIIDTVEQNIGEIPYAAGVNNHMGSRFTACGRGMAEVLEVVEKKALFFVDSLTSSRSTAYRTARRLHMPAARRNIFLDNVPHEPAVLARLARLKRHALKHGRAVGIGHPFPETAAAIRLFLENGGDTGISLVPVSGIL